MPPKGWKKNHEPSLLHQEVDLVSIDDILFPRATISKSIRAILDHNDDKITLSKDALTAIQRAATVFVSFMQFHARQFAKRANRKNVYASDILAGLEYAGFLGFVPHVRQLLATYEEDVSATRRRKAVERAGRGAAGQVMEPVLKKPKTEGGAVVGSQVVEVVSEDDDGNYGNEDNEDEGDGNDDEEDATKKNPIALLNQENQQLEGTGPERERDKDENESDDELS